MIRKELHQDDGFVRNTDRAMQLISFGVSDKEIRDRLVADGAEEYQAHFIVVGAKLMLKWREEDGR